MTIGDKMPSGYNYTADIEKIRTYVLNLAHKRGGDKAYILRQVLGYTQDDAEEFRQFILENVEAGTIKKIEDTVWGQKIRVDINTGIINHKGEAILLTAWIQEDLDKNELRLTTAYIQGR